MLKFFCNWWGSTSDWKSLVHFPSHLKICGYIRSKWETKTAPEQGVDKIRSLEKLDISNNDLSNNQTFHRRGQGNTIKSPYKLLQVGCLNSSFKLAMPCLNIDQPCSHGMFPVWCLHFFWYQWEDFSYELDWKQTDIKNANHREINPYSCNIFVNKRRTLSVS